MKIMVCGSMTFARQMKEAKLALEKAGHAAIIPSDTEMCIANPQHIDDLDADLKHCVENKIMKNHFKMIEGADAVLVLNYPKNGVKGYIGTASLMEIALAYHFGKKIFLLNAPPNPGEARWAHEVQIMQPKVLDGDFTRLE